MSRGTDRRRWNVNFSPSFSSSSSSSFAPIYPNYNTLYIRNTSRHKFSSDTFRETERRETFHVDDVVHTRTVRVRLDDHFLPYTPRARAIFPYVLYKRLIRFSRSRRYRAPALFPCSLSDEPINPPPDSTFACTDDRF